jgi:UDP-glucuronate 4-epimerase
MARPRRPGRLGDRDDCDRGLELLSPEPINGARILVTGVTGQVARPLARSLVAVGNTVYGSSRFSDPQARSAVEAEGIVPVKIDLERPELDEVPGDLDYVIHMAVSKDTDFDVALAANAEGTAFLIERVAGAKAFLHCSSCGVYEPNGLVPHVETDPLGDNHRPMGFLPTYSISKIAGESAAKYGAKRFGVPTVIARLDVPYGPLHGWPKIMLKLAIAGIPTAVHPEGPNLHNFLHDEDLLSSLPYLLEQAAVPAPIYNWCSPEHVSIEEWTAELTRLTGIEIPLQVTTACVPPNPVDPSKLLALGWVPSVGWKDGFRGLAKTSFPENYNG